MKTHICLLALFLSLNLCLVAQNFNYAFQPSFFSFANEIVEVGENRFVIGGQTGGFMGYPSFSPYLRMVDENGTLIWEKSITNVTGTELGEVLSMEVDDAGNILVAGLVMGCDYGLPGFLARYDTLGNQLSFHEVWGMYRFCELPDGSLAVLSDFGKLIKFDLAEGLIWETSFWAPGELFQSQEVVFGPDEHIYVLSEDRLVKVNLEGETIDEVAVTGGQTLQVSSDNNTLWLLSSGKLSKLDAQLNTIDEADLSAEGAFSKILIEDQLIFLLGRTAAERPVVVRVTNNLEVDHSFTFLEPHFIPYDFIIANNQLIFTGNELPDPYDSDEVVNVYNRTLVHRGSNIFLYATALDGTPSALADDAAILEVSFQSMQLDTLGTCGFTGSVAGTVTWEGIKILIQNQGTSTLESVTLNTSFVPCAFICPSRASINHTFENLLLSPGESTVLDWGTLQVPGLPFEDLAELCFWTSLPNDHIDGNHTNNSLCTDITIDTRKVIANPVDLIVFPNPVQDVLRVQFKGVHHQPQSFRITNITGQIVQQGLWPMGQPAIDIALEGLNAGVYSIQINASSQILVKQFVVVGG